MASHNFKAQSKEVQNTTVLITFSVEKFTVVCNVVLIRNLSKQRCLVGNTQTRTSQNIFSWPFLSSTGCFSLSSDSLPVYINKHTRANSLDQSFYIRGGWVTESISNPTKWLYEVEQQQQEWERPACEQVEALSDGY